VQTAAILVIGDQLPASTRCDNYSSRQGLEAQGPPLACVEILGRSVVEHTVRRLDAAGVKNISFVTEDLVSSFVPVQFTQDPQISMFHQPGNPWLLAARLLSGLTQSSVQTVLLIGLGAYVEFDFADVLRFHSEKGKPVTRIHDQQGPLDFWLLQVASNGHNGSSANSLSLLDSDANSTYRHKGYVNRLRDARDLRRLVVDAFLARCAIRPAGRELKPGVWIDEGARVHRYARVVAPAYIGRKTRVQESALITRFSNIESHCDVECDCAVEDASVLPYTHLGRGIDVSHAVVNGSNFVHLGRNVAVSIDDPKLIGKNLSSEWRLFNYHGKPADSDWLRQGSSELDRLPSLSGVAVRGL
jgi:NDP-sugar pyrophosphorylase family protein